MKNIKLILVFLLFVTIPATVFAGPPEFEDFPESDTDTAGDTLSYFFDLRDRETFIQLSYAVGIEDEDSFDDSQNLNMHVIIYDVSTDCIENDFFDVYTPADTHVYNMRDIQTNDGNPSGVVLPDGAYGFVHIIPIDPEDNTLFTEADVLFGNFRIIDNAGYEYRTNASVEDTSSGNIDDGNAELGYFNYNTDGGVTLSDIVAATYDDDDDSLNVEMFPLDNFAVLDIDIYDLNEVPFSCRNVIFACISPDSPLQEALLEKASDSEFSSAGASVARAEYGINNTIPHSKGGELLCPGNNISEGFVKMQVLNRFIDNPEERTLDDIVVWIGLNNGNGRGSMDSNWIDSDVDPDPDN